MLKYPDPFRGFPEGWIEDIGQFHDKEVILKLEKKDVLDFIKHPGLIAHYKKLKELCSLPKAPEYGAMKEDKKTWLHVVPKKKHEIARLAPYLDHLYQNKKIDRILDIGGGIGVLAQILVNEYQMKVISLDMNADFQKTGFTRHEKFAKDPSHKVSYKNIKVEANDDFLKLLGHNVMPIGLHTCGKLALDIIRTSSSQKVPALVNFGCCYQTLAQASELQHLSSFAKNSHPLWLNKFALTLAGRAHRKMEEEDFDFKLKVKHYRYAIHVLFFEHYGLHEFTSLGNSNLELYNKDFATYALEQMKRINLSPKHSEKELNGFFKDSKLQKLIRDMLTAGIIRDAFGRALEIYLLLDRVIFLEEQSYEVRLEEFFDEELSPRNIGITAFLV